MKILKFLLITLAALVVVYLMAALLAPKTFYVQRKIVINAAPGVVFKNVNSFQKWESWNPWRQTDSTIKNTYSGPDAGIGNRSAWTSAKSGTGSMTIVESTPNSSIRSEVVIGNFNPFYGIFTFAKVDSGTEVTWTDSGSMKYPMNIMTLFADKMFSPDLEAGLKNLKKYVEALPKWKLGEYKIDEQPSQHILALMDSCPANGIGPKLGALYGEIGAVMKKNKLDFAGAPMAYYYSYTPDKVVLEAAIAVNKEVKGEGRVTSRTVPVTKALSVSYFGDYAMMSEAYATITSYMKQNNLQQNGPECDVYVTDPGNVKDKMQLETKMVFPVK
jgi:effector-binding domain-containing protein